MNRDLFSIPFYIVDATEEHPQLISAIGASGDALLPVGETGSVARRGAVNADPYHDESGRFTTGDKAVPPQDRARSDPKDATGGGAASGPVASIAGHAYNSRSRQTCVVAAARSMIATMRASALADKPVPSENETEMQFANAAGTNINWGEQGLLTLAGPAYARIVQNVLTQNGIASTASFNYPSAKALADDLVATGMPAIANIITADLGKTVYEHAVIMQWDQGSQQFLINNIDAQGRTTRYTKSEFEYGDLRVDTGSTGAPRRFYTKVDLRYAVIFAKKR